MTRKYEGGRKAIEALPYRPCVGLVILNASGEVWIGRRFGSARHGGPAGWWQMPQGGIDEGETPAVAALRELAEETGIRSATILGESEHWHAYDLPGDLQGRVWGGRYRGQTQRWFAIRFSGPESEVDIAPVDHDPEFDSWRWAAVDEVLDLAVPFKRDVYEKVLSEFRARGLLPGKS